MFLSIPVLTMPAFSQAFESVFFKGIIKNNAIFSGDKGDNFEDLYALDEETFEFLKFEDNKIQSNYSFWVGYSFVAEGFRGYSLLNDIPYSFAFELNGEFKIYFLGFLPMGDAYDIPKGMIYLSVEDENPDFLINLPIKQLNLSTGQIVELPVKGIRPIVIDNYLYYSAYPDSTQFDLVVDIYRVKIDDWNNSELIFKKNYAHNWGLSSDGKYLIASIIEKGYKPQLIIYNLDIRRYTHIEIDDRHTPYFFSITKNAFCFYDTSLRNGVRNFHYIPIPESFPYTPDWAMEFGDSFINHYWIEEAPEDSLRTVDKSQLRLLRNSVFARRGWRFTDQVLADFFSQFEWYRDQLARSPGNDKIQLTNTDKYRSNLILKIENEK